MCVCFLGNCINATCFGCNNITTIMCICLSFDYFVIKHYRHYTNGVCGESDDSLKAHSNTSLINAHVLCMSATVLITYKTTYIYTAA